MVWLLDGLLIVLFAACVYLGWQRGFVKTFSRLLVLLISVLVSAVFGGPVATVVNAHNLSYGLTRLICSVVLFVITYALASLVIGVLNWAAKLPLLKQMNRLLGLIAGVVSGALWVLFAVGMIWMVAQLGWIAPLTPAVVEKTWLMSWVGSLLSAVGI